MATTRTTRTTTSEPAFSARSLEVRHAVGWVVGTRIAATDLLGAVGLGAAIGVGSAVVMAGVALTVDPSLARRLRRLRRPAPRVTDAGGRS